MTPTPTRSRRRLIGALLVGVVSVSACSGGGDAAAPAPTTTTTTSVEEAVLDAYLAFWDAFFLAADPPDPDHPALAEVATGEQLERLQELFAQRQADGIANRRGATRQRPHVVSATPDRATVADCWLDEAVLVDVETGKVIGDRKVWTEGEFLLVREGGTWKVASNAITERGDDQPCEI